MTIALIVAMAEDRVIGSENTIPWHIPEELQLFKAHTMGHPILMGRKTYDSIGKALPGRKNIVVTRDIEFRAQGCTVYIDLEKALIDHQHEKLFVIGGEHIFAQTLSLADELYITYVKKQVAGDRFFPAFDEGRFEVVDQQVFDGDPPYTFIHYRKKSHEKDAPSH